jgi:hypothetical protein
MAYVKIGTRFVILCEGPADKAFLVALRNRRTLPQFDVPFPPDQPQAKQYPSGRGAFERMLTDVATDIRLDPTLDVRGLLVVADSADDSGDTLKLVPRQCRQAGFDPPPATNEWSRRVPPLPPGAVLLIPDGVAGGLESVCLNAPRPRHQEVAACLDSFLACVPTIERTAEKRDKAALACITAAAHPSDPTRSVQSVFSYRDAFIDLADPAFNELADRLRTLLTSVEPPPVAP